MVLRFAYPPRPLPALRWEEGVLPGQLPGQLTGQAPDLATLLPILTLPGPGPLTEQLPKMPLLLPVLAEEVPKMAEEAPITITTKGIRMNTDTDEKFSNAGGRPALPDEQKRRHQYTVRLTAAEVELMEQRRGKLSAGVWLGRAAFSSVGIPELNRVAWAELSRAAANLNQIARRANTAGDLELVRVFDDARQELAAFRRALIQATNGGSGYEG